MPAQQESSGAMYDISPKSSIFADTRAAATSGGNFVFGANPNLDALFGGGSGMPSWLMPAAAVVAALAIVGFIVLRASKK